MEQKLSGTGDISSQAFYVEIEGPRHWRDAVELALVAGTVGLISSLFLTPYMAVATFSYGCLVAGLWVRKKRNAHL
ncbi:MAG: hypothetical protein ACXVBE_12820, partial [Bdellovibrionota bacterium]